MKNALEPIYLPSHDVVKKQKYYSPILIINSLYRLKFDKKKNLILGSFFCQILLVNIPRKKIIKGEIIPTIIKYGTSNKNNISCNIKSNPNLKKC